MVVSHLKLQLMERWQSAQSVENREVSILLRESRGPQELRSQFRLGGLAASSIAGHSALALS